MRRGGFARRSRAASPIRPRTIRIPVHMIETINKLVRTSRQILHEIGREPTPEELAERLSMPLEKVRKVMKIAKEPISLETPIGDEGGFSHLGDFIQDPNAVIPVDAAIHSNLKETVTRVLASLTAARGACAAHAVRYRHEHRPHARGSRPAVQRLRANASARSRRRRCASSSTRAGRGRCGAFWTFEHSANRLPSVSQQFDFRKSMIKCLTPDQMEVAVCGG